MTDYLWCVTVQRTDGSLLNYRLSDDLQFGLNIDPKGQRHLTTALIVIPLAPYLYDHPGMADDVLPPYGVGQVQRIFQVSREVAGDWVPTRSQFIGDNAWHTAAFTSVEGYLKHDYQDEDRLRIAEDIQYWQSQVKHRPFHQSCGLRKATNRSIEAHLARVSQRRTIADQSEWQLAQVEVPSV